LKAVLESAVQVLHNTITSLPVYLFMHWLCLHVSTDRVNKSHQVDNFKHCLTEGRIKCSSMCDLCVILLTLDPGQNNDRNWHRKTERLGIGLHAKPISRYGVGDTRASLAPKNNDPPQPIALYIVSSAPQRVDYNSKHLTVWWGGLLWSPFTSTVDIWPSSITEKPESSGIWSKCKTLYDFIYDFWYLLYIYTQMYSHMKLEKLEYRAKVHLFQ